MASNTLPSIEACSVGSTNCPKVVPSSFSRIQKEARSRARSSSRSTTPFSQCVTARSPMPMVAIDRRPSLRSARGVIFWALRTRSSSMARKDSGESTRGSSARAARITVVWASPSRPSSAACARGRWGTAPPGKAPPGARPGPSAPASPSAPAVPSSPSASRPGRPLPNARPNRASRRPSRPSRWVTRPTNCPSSSWCAVPASRAARSTSTERWQIRSCRFVSCRERSTRRRADAPSTGSWRAPSAARASISSPATSSARSRTSRTRSNGASSTPWSTSADIPSPPWPHRIPVQFPTAPATTGPVPLDDPTLVHQNYMCPRKNRTCGRAPAVSGPTTGCPQAARAPHHPVPSVPCFPAPPTAPRR